VIDDTGKTIILWLLILTTIMHLSAMIKYHYKSQTLNTLMTLARMYATDLEVDFATMYYTGGQPGSQSEAMQRRLFHYQRAKQLAELTDELTRASWVDTVRIKRRLDKQMANYWELEDI